MIKVNSQSGVTLVEMTIYIALVALISTSLVTLYIQIIKLKSKSISIQEVNESIRLAASKIDFEISQASRINSIGTSLSLASTEAGRNPTIIDLHAGRIRLTVGASTAYITSNLVNIDTFTLQNLSTGDSTAQNVRFTISGSYGESDLSITSSTELRSK